MCIFRPTVGEFHPLLSQGVQKGHFAGGGDQRQLSATLQNGQFDGHIDSFKDPELSAFLGKKQSRGRFNKHFYFLHHYGKVIFNVDGFFCQIFSTV